MNGVKAEKLLKCKANSSFLSSSSLCCVRAGKDGAQRDVPKGSYWVFVVVVFSYLASHHSAIHPMDLVMSS